MERIHLDIRDYKVKCNYNLPEEIREKVKNLLYEKAFYSISPDDYSQLMTHWCLYDFKSRRIKESAEYRKSKAFSKKKDARQSVQIYDLHLEDNFIVTSRIPIKVSQKIHIEKKILEITFEKAEENIYSFYMSLDGSKNYFYNQDSKRKLKTDTRFCCWSECSFINISQEVFEIDDIKKSSFDKLLNMAINNEIGRNLSDNIITCFKYFEYRKKYPEIDNLIQKDMSFVLTMIDSNVNLYNFFFEGKSFKKNFILPKDCLPIVLEESKKIYNITSYDLMGILNKIQFHTRAITKEVLEEMFALKRRTNIYRNNFFHDFKEIVIEHNIDIKQLFAYIERANTYQAIEPSETLSLYKDYLSSVKRLNMQNFDKYPSSLKREHDLFSREVTKVKNELEEQSFEDVMEQYQDIEYKDKDFCIVVPKVADDLRDEGRELSHCVGSYVSKVAKKKSIIFFVRDRKHKDRPLYTLEVENNKAVQFRGKYNASATKEARAFADMFILEALKGLKKGEVAGLAI